MGPLNPLAAGLLVFTTSGAVLVLEILALRLFAPYAGVTIESYTAIIGTVLAGIAGGTWAGGAAADRVAPRKLIGPLLVVGGAMAMATVPAVRVLGERLGGGTPSSVVTLAFASFFLPAALLSAVSPAVVKLQLRDLAATGRVVGRLSALGTAGAIAGTFVAGFVLVEAAPTATSILAIGASLVAAGGVVWVWAARRKGAVVAAALTMVATGLVAGAATEPSCDVETTYHCARIVAGPLSGQDRPGGRLLVLDTEWHSYVDLDDPAHLEFRYTKVVADVISATTPAGPLDALHVGGGGFTMPRWLASTRPGSTSTVLEIDGGLVSLARDRLALDSIPDVDVRVGDARLLVGRVGAAHDVVVGDAFSGLTVPWHLTTAEFARQLRAALAAGGVYVMNVVDYPPLRFARAEAATLAKVFAHVALVVPPDVAAGSQGGNLILAASDSPIDVNALRAQIAVRGGIEVVVVGAGLDDFVAGAPTLTDSLAPVDQWLARARPL